MHYPFLTQAGDSPGKSGCQYWISKDGNPAAIRQ
jgi:hypothetical protein